MSVVFKEGEFDNAYVTVSDYLTEYFYKTDRILVGLIVFLSTDNGKHIDKEIANVNQFGTYYFENDWYEGGNVILYGFTRVCEVDMGKEFNDYD